MGWKTGLNIYGKAVALNMPHQKLIRVLNYVWLLVVFPVAVAILVGVLGHNSANLGFKTFLLIEGGMAVLSPLSNTVISDDNYTHHHRAKIVVLRAGQSPGVRARETEKVPDEEPLGFAKVLCGV